MVLNRTWNFKNLHRIMCLALCLGVVCFALAGNAWAGTTRLQTGVTVPTTIAQELTLSPNKIMSIYTALQYGNTYKLVGPTSGSYNSDVYRDMAVAPAGNFYVVVNLPANVYFQGSGTGSNCPTGVTCRTPLVGDISISGGGGGATFSVSGTSGTNGATFVTYLATVTTTFTSAPTLTIGAGTNGWTIRDYNNKLATAGSAGAIAISVLTYDATSLDMIDPGSDAVTVLQSAAAIQISQALSPTTAAINLSTLRKSFTPTAPDDATHDNGANLGIGYVSPMPLNAAGGTFTLTSADKVAFSFTSSADFSALTIDPVDPGLPTYPGTIPGIVWAGIPATYSAGTTKTLNVPGNSAAISGTVQPFVFTVDGVTTIVPRSLYVKIDLIIAVGGSNNAAPGPKTLLGAPSPVIVTQWTQGGVAGGQVVLFANWLNGNTAAYNSRVYLYNSNSIPADITVRVLKMPSAGGTPASAEITTPGSPIFLGTLSGYSGMSIKLKEDVLNYLLAALPGGTLPYTENSGNLMMEITARGVSGGMSGTSQVFGVNASTSAAFGQVPLVIIP